MRVILGVILILAGPAIAQDHEDADGDVLEQSLALLDAQDRIRVTIDAADVVLAQAVDELDERLPFPFRADWEALDRIGVEPRDRVSMDLADAPVRTVFAALTLQLGDRLEHPVIEAYAGHLVLTTMDATASMGLTDVYDLRDLLHDEHAEGALIGTAVEREMRVGSFDPPAADTPENAGDDAGDDAGDGDQDDDDRGDETEDGDGGETASDTDGSEKAAPRPQRPMTAGERLLYLIGDHVDPDGWIDNGGTRTSMHERGGVMVVSAPPTVHARVRGTLQRLRRARLATVGVDVAIVDLPRRRFTALTRRFDVSSARLGRAVLRAPEGTVRWRTTTAAALDRTSESKSRDAEAGGYVRVGVTPRFDADEGLLVVDLDIETSDGGDTRSIKTVIAVPARDGGAVLELPGTTVDDSTRYVVVLPRQG